MSDQSPPSDTDRPALVVRSDRPFYVGLGVIGGAYILLLGGMLLAQLEYASASNIVEKLSRKEIQYSIKLSLITCAITTVLSLWVSVPIGYVMSRHQFRGKTLVDALLDMPIVLPPLVVGLCLLILFNTSLFNGIEAFLHGVEGWVSDNLVPLTIFSFLSLLGIVAYFQLAKAITSRSVRFGLILLVSVGTTLAFSGKYLFPELPDWVPVPEEFELVDVDYRDQAPLRNARHRYRGVYTFEGTADELQAALDRFFDGNSKFSLRPMGERLGSLRRRRFLIVPIGDKNNEDSPSEIVATVTPQGDPPGNSSTKTDWRIEYDVRRTAKSAKDNLAPPLTFPIAFDVAGIVLAQFMVACAFAVRTMRVTFDQISPRYEHVALTLGCNRSQAFWQVLLPQTRRGMLAAGTLAWARSLGEFGPILIFAGSTRLKTEVLSTTVFLELQVGDLTAAVSASLIMIFSAVVVLVIARVFGLKRAAL